MSISLEAVTFNHNLNSFDSDAFNIRRNREQVVPIPEWRRGVSVNHEDSPAAYAIRETTGKTITIKVKFKRTGDPAGDVEIRALETVERLVINNGPRHPLADLIHTIVNRVVGATLGDVAATPVTFGPDGNSDFVEFELPNTRLGELGVGISDITWCWQFAGPSGVWTDFAVSRHRIYSVLNESSPPWRLSPPAGAEINLPWTEVLDYACSWASGAKTITDAAKLITRALYELGPGKVLYNQTRNYTLNAADAFHCAQFLFDLRSSRARVNVNCTDCATIVSTIANLLGCSLFQSSMLGFNYNPILRIGESEAIRDGFGFHEVAWEFPCGETEDVYDACLQLDGNRNTAEFDDPLLATDLRFGRSEPGSYRFHLVVPNQLESPENGRPLPDSRKRRELDPSPLRMERRDGMRLFTFAVDTFGIREDELSGEKAEWLFYRNYTPHFSVPAGWSLVRAERFKTAENNSLLLTNWAPPGDPGGKYVRVDVYEGSSPADASEQVVVFLAALHSFNGVERGPDDLGDISFVLKQSRVVVFARANLMIIVRDADGSEGAPPEELARLIDQSLVGAPREEDDLGARAMMGFRLAAKEGFTGVNVPLDVEEGGPLEGLPLTYKFVSANGSVVMQDGRLVYLPRSTERPQVLTVYAINRNGSAFRQDLEIPSV
jgi:hypothetical protein